MTRPGGTARGLPLPVYIFPCRIQQGLGEWVETARAVRLLPRAGYPLYHLRSPPSAGAGRSDPRAVPLDPSRKGGEPFPPVRGLSEPLRAPRAVAVVTWFGITARKEDAAGERVPGPLADRFDRLRDAHPDGLLVLSLEEFGTARTSREAVAENLRQAGATGASLRQLLRSPAGQDRVRRYREAFWRARAGEREDVLHLFPEFFPSLPALREFPFALPIAPFSPRPRARRARSPPPTPVPLQVVWYASASTAPRLLGPLLEALGGLSGPVDLAVRPGPAWRTPVPPSASPPSVRVTFLPPEGRRPWERRLGRAALRVVGGSQTLLEAVFDRAPFLYFNGALPTPSGRTVGFRREKLLSLLRGAPSRPVERTVARDLRAFADLDGVTGVVRRAATSRSWRLGLARLCQPAGQGFPPPLRPGERYLLHLVRSFDRTEEPVARFVERTRRWHRRALGAP